MQMAKISQVSDLSLDNMHPPHHRIEANNESFMIHKSQKALTQIGRK